MMLEPKFIEMIKNPEIKNILLVGCGGGFDFIHGMLLYPELIALNKNVVIGSYSFGLLDKIPDAAETVYQHEDIEVKKCTAELSPDMHYAPEINLCSYLDLKYPESNHYVYAYYARDFTVKKLYDLYEHLCEQHSIDCVIAIDGGSDSLMAGDEAGLGDVVEDLVSVTAISMLDKKIGKLLFTIGVGADRFNDVSDASALRAISELQARNGFLGSIGLEKENSSYRFYKECIEHINSRQSFKSTIAGFVLASIEGYHGNEQIPSYLERKLTKHSRFYIWPIMGLLWCFDINVVAERSMIPDAIRGASTVEETWKAVTAFRQSIYKDIREVEDLPQHGSMRNSERYNFTTGMPEGGIFDEFAELEEI